MLHVILFSSSKFVDGMLSYIANYKSTILTNIMAAQLAQTAGFYDANYNKICCSYTIHKRYERKRWARPSIRQKRHGIKNQQEVCYEPTGNSERPEKNKILGFL